MIERPDSELVAELYPSPNIEPRRGGMKPTILLMHYTGLPTVEKALDVLSRPDCKVSCHYVVDLDGRIIQMVAESERAWHSGASFWTGETDINSASIGIEIQNAGQAGGDPDFPQIQMHAVARLSRDIIARHGIVPARVLAHSDVAPGRKIDPGEKFDWRWLYDQGVGHWVEPAPFEPADLGPPVGAAAPAVTEARAALARYGYGIDPEGEFDEAMRRVVSAFQLHFRQACVDGRLDRSTTDTLSRLLTALATV